jgi:Leucine-rich repeat (LRR) protein
MDQKWSKNESNKYNINILKCITVLLSSSKSCKPFGQTVILQSVLFCIPTVISNPLQSVILQSVIRWHGRVFVLVKIYKEILSKNTFKKLELKNIPPKKFQSFYISKNQLNSIIPDSLKNEKFMNRLTFYNNNLNSIKSITKLKLQYFNCPLFSLRLLEITLIIFWTTRNYILWYWIYIKYNLIIFV